MKKTILTVSMVALTMGTGLMANDRIGTTCSLNHVLISEIEISSFCKAVMQGDVDTVERLIALGEDVNQKSLGMTPAMFAARYNKVKVLGLLLAHGADLTLKSDSGFTAKDYAKMSNAKDVLEVIESNL